MFVHSFNSVTMRKHICLFLLLGWGCLISVRAQSNYFKEPIPPTPNAAALGKYGDIPVSHHTGVPNISIPIDSVVQGSLSLPISLNYHSSGIKVEEISSWVGLGWSLNAGGMISRTVQGAPDEGPGYPLTQSKSSRAGWGFYKDGGYPPELDNCGTQNGSGYVNSNCESDLAGECDCKEYYSDAANGYLDAEPDLFTFNIGGVSGKFFFDENGTPHIFPKLDVKIEPVNNPNYFHEWKITNSDGTTYYLGGALATENQYTNTQGLSTSEADLSSTTWYLTKIVSANKKDSIELFYVKENYSYASRTSHSVSIGGELDGNGGTIKGPCTVNGDPDDIPTYLMLNDVKGVRLCRITTSSGIKTVNFEASSTLRQDLSKFGLQNQVNEEARALSKIIITNGSVVRSFNLDIDYFLSAEEANLWGSYQHTFDIRRLRLNSIQEFNASQQGLPAHTFTYNTTEQMPRRISLARDHWGYYNGANNNSGLIPNGTTYTCAGNQFTINNGVNRDPNETKMQAWILTGISYPTGGTTTFSYEAHRESASNPIRGGLRVAQITSNDDGDSPDLVKTFTYGTGILYAGTPQYVSDPNQNPIATGYNFTGLRISIGSSPNPALRTTQGYHIGYSSVDVDMGGNGTSTYKYKNVVPTPVTPIPVIPNQFILGTGELLGEEHKDESGNTVSKTSFFYKDDVGPILVSGRKVGTYLRASTIPCGYLPPDCNDFPLYSNYEVKTARYLLERKEELLDGVLTTTTYTYDSQDRHGNPVVEQVTNGNGNIYSTFRTYAPDFSASATITPIQDMNVVQEMINRNMYSIPLIENQKENSIFIGGRFTEYGNISDDIHPIAIYQYEPSKSTGSPYLGSYVKRAVFDKYSAFDRVLEYHLEDDVAHTSYLWGYNSSVPTAKVIYATQEQIAYTSFEVKNNDVNEQGNWVLSESSQIQDQPQSWPILTNGTGQISQRTLSSHDGSNVTVTVSTIPNGLAVPFNYINLETQSSTTIDLETGLNSVSLAPGTYVFEITNTTGEDLTASYTNTVQTYSGFENIEAGQTGENTYQLLSPNTISRSGLPTGIYRLAYWEKGGSVSVSLSSNATVVNTQTHSGTNGWQLVISDINISSAGGQITLSGNSVYIDELRLHPKDGQMITYCYDSALRLITVSDLNLQSTYYTYDGYNRLTETKDHNQDLRQRMQYHYINQPTN